jgi:Tol biopolymer transport system component
VESVTPLTDDGEPKLGMLVTDGSRIYFNEGTTGSYTIAQVAVTGGQTARVETRLAEPWILGLAPDSSALLALFGDGPTNPLWSIPLPAGEPRYLDAGEVVFATYFPDGRLLLLKGQGDLYVADNDGSNQRKLVSVAGNVLPSVSPDGKHIVVTADNHSLAEIAADGTGFRTIVTTVPPDSLGLASWSPDGKYLVFKMQRGRASDIWALPMHTGLFHRSQEPIRLTNGPLFYSLACPSRDGKQIFAYGTKRRGELVRYDMQSHQFVPFLSGISAFDPKFSRDGQWVAYTSYPDHTLWRSRSDGGERMQLTYPPMEVGLFSISLDGTKVAFGTSHGETYVVSMAGGLPARIVDKNSEGGAFSPDGNILVGTAWTDAHAGEQARPYLETFDLRTGKLSIVPSSQGMFGVMWITQDSIIAATHDLTKDLTKFVTFDFKTQKWSDLIAGNFVNWNLSPDGKYFYFTTGGALPKVQRLRFADRKIETIASLKDLRRVVDTLEGTQVNVAPDGSPVFTRDIGTQEIYALNVRWP